MKRYAVFISCEEYKEFDDIAFCHSDSVLMENTLVEYCDYDRKDVQLLLIYLNAPEYDVPYLYQIISDIIDRMEKEDTFLFYFAGHGMLHKEDEYLILPNTIQNNIEGTALSLKKLNNILRRAKGHTFRILDACHSGKDVRGVRENTFIREIIKSSWATLASCSENECSYSDDKLEQGIFTYHIAEEIKKWELGKGITFEALKILLCKDLQQWEKDKNNGHIQTPTLNGSIIGNVDFATRNEKEYEYVLRDRKISIGQKGEVLEKNTELSIVNNQSIALWEPNAGIVIPKSADVIEILRNNVQLKEMELKGIYNNYQNESYEFAAEPLWNRTISLLRKRVLALGEEFVSEMVGIDKLEYVRKLPDFEVINLAMELGFINSTGKMRLMHAYETITHYFEDREVKDEMTKSEAESIIRACIQYVLGIDESEVVFEYNDFRTSLKLEKLDGNTTKLEMLKNSPYFYKRTTIRTFVNLISTTEGAEFENVISNFDTVLSVVWNELSSDDKYFVGTTYNKYVSKGKKEYIIPIQNALKKVGGFDYVPESLRSLSFVSAAKKVKGVHYEINNFYNEPSAVKELGRMGSKIPRPAIKEVISATFMVLMGNAYGRSFDAVEPAKNILKKLTESDWIYYIEQCLPYDEEVLSKMYAGDARTGYWCEILDEFEIGKYDFSNTKIKEFIKYSVKGDRRNVKAIAGAYLKKIGSM